MAPHSKKNLNLLAISYGTPNASAVLMRQGIAVAAAKEEWFSSIPEDPSFPRHSINFCLQSQNIIINDIDAIIFPQKPYLNFYQTILKHLKKYPLTLLEFIKEIPNWLSEGLLIEFNIREQLGYQGDILFVPNHLAHAANAFFSSPFDEAAFLIINKGEKNIAIWGLGNNKKIEIKKELFGQEAPSSFSINEALKEIKHKTESINLCLSGEFTPKLSSIDKFLKIHKAPLLKNDGATLGAAYFANSQLLNNDSKKPNRWDIGPTFNEKEIERFICKHKLPFQILSEEEKRKRLNELIEQNISHYFIKSPINFSDDFSSRAFYEKGKYYPISSVAIANPEDIINAWKNSSAPYLFMDHYVISKN